MVENKVFMFSPIIAKYSLTMMTLRGTNYSFLIIFLIILTFNFWYLHRQEELHAKKIAQFQDSMQLREKEYENKAEESMGQIAVLKEKVKALENRIVQYRITNNENLKDLDTKTREIHAMKLKISQLEKEKVDLLNEKKEAEITPNMKPVQDAKQDEPSEDLKTMTHRDMKEVKNSRSQISNNFTRLNSEERARKQFSNSSQFLQRIFAEYLNTSQNSLPTVSEAHQPENHTLIANVVQLPVKQNMVTPVAKGDKETPESKVIATE